MCKNEKITEERAFEYVVAFVCLNVYLFDLFKFTECLCAKGTSNRHKTHKNIHAFSIGTQFLMFSVWIDGISGE